VIIELHVIQNVVPANLNRDDTGAPKDAVFGGYRRARVSSQAWKRAIRVSFDTQFSDDELGWRTRRLVEQVTDALVAAGRDPEQAHAVATAALTEGGAGIDAKSGRTTVLWLVARRSIDTLTELCATHWDVLASGAKLPAETSKLIKETVRTDVVGARAVDIALFGRMLTDAPHGGTVDAAAQVAHALSTHAVDTEFDYFTAVDDLLPSDESGAGMVGTVEFNSACFYRYACLDTTQLMSNLDGDAELARRGALAFATDFVTVMPTGKQNTFAAHNPPAAALVVTREAGAWNLANAFADPVHTGRGQDLVRGSCERLARHWTELVSMYADPATSLGVTCLPSLADAFTPIGTARRGPLDEVIGAAVDLALPARP